LGRWISPCYGLFSLGARFETYEPFIYLIFNFWWGRGKPQITETADTESADTGARLYYYSLNELSILYGVTYSRTDVGKASKSKVDI
jgi:hypothetical protein